MEIKNKITWERMSEIATQALHKLLEYDREEAIEFFNEELYLTEEESKYFEVPTESEPYEFTCSDCPYYYSDSYEDDEPERCHYTNHDGCAPCEYEEPEETDWSQYE